MDKRVRSLVKSLKSNWKIFKNRIRRRANHDVESVLEEIERMNRAVSRESEV